MQKTKGQWGNALCFKTQTTGVVIEPGHTPIKSFRRAVLATFLGLGLIGMAPVYAATAAAQATLATAQTSAQYDFKIAAGPLAQAAAAFSSVSGFRVMLAANQLGALNVNAVSGRLTVDAALSLMLRGVKATYRFSGDDKVLIEAGPDVDGSRVLGAVKVEATEQTAVGINGSTDITATENSGSYTNGLATVASKSAQSLQETPQTVSVITQQQMRDQGITDFTSMMKQAAGITVSQDDPDPMKQTFYSRGFKIERLQVDGGAPIDISDSSHSLLPQINMAMYDHAEILRGADGLYNGDGNPGGSVNLTRKRPLDHSQVNLSVSAGSWDDYDTTVDVTGPLAFDGRLRGRLVLDRETKDYFYKTAKDKKELAYGVLEGDLTSSTTLRVGHSKSTEDATPFYGGLPRYSNGKDLHLPRDFCLCFDWNRAHIETDETFVGLDQAIGDNWTLKVNAAHTTQSYNNKFGSVSGTVDPVTGEGAYLGATMADRESTQDTADFALSGGFDILGHRQTMTVGGNTFYADGGGNQSYPQPDTGYPAVNVLNFNAKDFAEPANTLYNVYYPIDRQSQHGYYANFNLSFWEPLHFLAGFRYSAIKSENETDYLCRIAGTYYCDGSNVGQPGVELNSGDVGSRSISKYSNTYRSTPSMYGITYDLTKQLTFYTSYTSINQDQSTKLTSSLAPLAPVTGSNIEAGLKWASADGTSNASLSAYRIVQKNYGILVDYGPYASTYGTAPDGIHTCCYQVDPTHENKSKGIDLEFTGQVIRDLDVTFSYTFNMNDASSTGTVFDPATGLTTTAVNSRPMTTKAPRHLVKLWTHYKLPQEGWMNGFGVGLGARAQSSSFTAGSVCSAYSFTNNPATGGLMSSCDKYSDFQFTQTFYTVVDALVDYKIDKHWSLALNANNLFDRVYYQSVGSADTGNWYGEPRNYKLTLRGTF